MERERERKRERERGRDGNREKVQWKHGYHKIWLRKIYGKKMFKMN